MNLFKRTPLVITTTLLAVATATGGAAGAAPSAPAPSPSAPSSTTTAPSSPAPSSPADKSSSQPSAPADSGADENLNRTEVKLSSGDTKPAADVTKEDKVVGAVPAPKEGSLKAQIGKHGAVMGQSRFLDQAALRQYAQNGSGAQDAPSTPGAASKPAGAKTASQSSSVAALRENLIAPSAQTASYAQAVPMGNTPWQAGSILGQDVSSFQTGVNFNTERAKGSQFAYVKSTEGQGAYKNPAWGAQYTGAYNAGMARGSYHFALPNQSSGAAQADWFVDNGGGWSADGRTMPGLLDIEWNPYPALGNSCFNLSQQQMRTWITQFQERYKQRTGRYPAIYSATMWWNTCVGSLPSASRSPLHLASYASQVGPMPGGTGWRDYDIWQYSDSGAFAGDQNVYGGSQAQFRSFVNNAGYTPLGTASAAPSTPTGQPLGPNDLAVVDKGTGALYRYPNGVSNLNTRTQIAGSGWQSAISVHVSDWNRDGVRDLVSQWASGVLAVSYGRSDGSFSGPQVIGNGWQGLDITVGQYAYNDRFDSILAVDSTGALRRYTGNGSGVAYTGVIGNGWRGLVPRLAQTDGTGAQEIVARYGDGSLRVYRRYNSGQFVPAPAKTVGWGWAPMTQLAAAQPGSNIWIVRDNAGNVRRYDFRGDVPGYQGQIGTGGWDTHTLSGSREL
ncbi:GH25 family lysozyme [Arthrobacter sp. UM1]|uniref:GH25 family lysozyme n=1 Tax=Arthrobacter sp. UM1 TaxID=2766776 RepID=UPI001CF6D7DE|nr:GH25 family lysozyme [Arthrobacter sp. UM1]MCB4207496.1 hypothetical protein [Arthrobacter sp. UM1]